MSEVARSVEPFAGAPVRAGARTERLSSGQIWAFSLPRVGFGIMGLLFGTYLMKFATDVLLIAPAAMGALLFVQRLWDGVSDPLAGYLSDRTRSRLGRRRIWMYAAAAPLGAALVMIWSPPSSLEGTELVLFMAAALLLYETASTAYMVPHGALGMELSSDYHERTRLFGWIHMIGALGTFLGLGSLQLMNSATDKRSFAWGLSLFAAAVIVGLIVITTARLREHLEYQGRGGRPLQSFADVFRNPHSRVLLLVFGIETFGSSSVGILVPYLTEYVLPMKELMVPLLLAYTIPSFALTPLWIRVARRVGKKRLWMFSMGLSGAVFAALFLTYFWPLLIWPLALVLGFAAGSGAVVGPAICADVIDYDEYRTGQRKEGSYLAVWNLVRKSAAALTAFLAGLALQGAGFRPNVAQTEAVKLAILALIGLLPAAGYAMGVLLFARFQLNEREHAEIRAAIAARGV